MLVDLLKVRSSPMSLATDYRAVGAQLTVRREGDLIALRVSQGDASLVALQLRSVCADMARQENVVLQPNAVRSSVFIRAEHEKRIIGLPLFSDRRGQYQLSFAKNDRISLPDKARALDLLALMDQAFAELADVVPDSFERPSGVWQEAHLLPATECVFMERRPTDEVLGFVAVPLFVADTRCVASMPRGSATICFVVIAGRRQTEAAVGEFMQRVSAQERATLAQREEELRHEREAEARANEAEQRRRGALEKQRMDAAVRAITAFRRSLKEGVETNCGPVLQVKTPLVKVYSPVKDYGNEHWLRIDAVFPPSYGCTFLNGRYEPPSP